MRLPALLLWLLLIVPRSYLEAPQPATREALQAHADPRAWAFPHEYGSAGRKTKILLGGLG